jgi:hypothetical protein
MEGKDMQTNSESQTTSEKADYIIIRIPLSKPVEHPARAFPHLGAKRQVEGQAGFHIP